MTIRFTGSRKKGKTALKHHRQGTDAKTKPSPAVHLYKPGHFVPGLSKRSPMADAGPDTRRADKLLRRFSWQDEED